MAAKNIAAVKDLKGKRLAVSALGDAPYNYTVALLGKFGLKARDVEWIPVGTDATARATAPSRRASVDEGRSVPCIQFP